jgi:hypothetical protein
VTVHNEPHIDQMAHLELLAILDLWDENEPELTRDLLEQFLAHVHVIPVASHRLEKEN